MANSDQHTAGEPSEEPSVIVRCDSPRNLDPLNPLDQDTKYVIANIGLEKKSDYKESLTIVAGVGAYKSFSGAPYTYVRDLEVETVRIVDSSHIPIYVQEDDPLRRINFVAMSYQELGDGRRIPVVTPLLPGNRHPITNRDGQVLGSFGIEEDGSLQIARIYDTDTEGGNVRIVSNTDGREDYIKRPALEQVQRKVQIAPLGPIQRATTIRPQGNADLVVDPGILAAAIDAATGQTVTGIVQRPMRIPRGQEGRQEQWVADLLKARQQSQDRAREAAEIQVKPAARARRV